MTARVRLDAPTRGVRLGVLVSVVCGRCGNRTVAHVDRVLDRDENTVVVTTAVPLGARKPWREAGGTDAGQLLERVLLDSVTGDSVAAYCPRHGRAEVPLDQLRATTALASLDSPRVVRILDTSRHRP